MSPSTTQNMPFSWSMLIPPTSTVTSQPLPQSPHHLVSSFEITTPNDTPTPDHPLSSTSPKAQPTGKEDQYIPRPPNCFILFRSWYNLNVNDLPQVDHVPNANTKSTRRAPKKLQNQVSCRAATAWNALPDSQKVHFQRMAEIKKLEHKVKYGSAYKYSSSAVRREKAKAKALATTTIKQKKTSGSARKAKPRSPALEVQDVVSASPRPQRASTPVTVSSPLSWSGPPSPASFSSSSSSSGDTPSTSPERSPSYAAQASLALNEDLLADSFAHLGLGLAHAASNYQPFKWHAAPTNGLGSQTQIETQPNLWGVSGMPWDGHYNINPTLNQVPPAYIPHLEYQSIHPINPNSDSFVNLNLSSFPSNSSSPAPTSQSPIPEAEGPFSSESFSQDVGGLPQLGGYGDAETLEDFFGPLVTYMGGGADFGVDSDPLTSATQWEFEGYGNTDGGIGAGVQLDVSTGIYPAFNGWVAPTLGFDTLGMEAFTTGDCGY